MTIGVIGSRRRASNLDYQLVRTTLLARRTSGRPNYVSGGCPVGGDNFCERVARELGASLTIHYADWNGLGKRAGFARNGLIAAEADLLIACVAPDRTGGTEDTIAKFLKTHGHEDLLLL